jgi:hypothetical protein
MILTAVIRSDDGVALGALILNEKVFSSGKAGFFGQGKLVINGARYQAQAQIVEIAGKDAASSGASA